MVPNRSQYEDPRIAQAQGTYECVASKELAVDWLEHAANGELLDARFKLVPVSWDVRGHGGEYATAISVVSNITTVRTGKSLQFTE